MVNLLEGDEQLQLIASVVSFLSEKLPVQQLHSEATSLPRENDIWQDICDQGWFAMNLSEDHGGSGFTFGDEMLIYREFGRYLLSPSILATRLALHAAVHDGDTTAAENLLSGKWKAAVGIAKPDASLDPKNSAGTFQVLDGDQADLVVIWNNDGLALIDRDTFTSFEPAKAMDWSSAMTLGTLGGVAPRTWVGADRLNLPAQANTLIAAMLIGNAEATRDMAVEYAKLREQFGRAIGSFQAVKHHCANLAMRAEASWAQTIFAGLSLEKAAANGLYNTHAAKILAADAAIKNSEMNIQIHGGIGFTADADPQLFLRRAHLFNQIGGNIRQHQASLIALENFD